MRLATVQREYSVGETDWLRGREERGERNPACSSLPVPLLWASPPTRMLRSSHPRPGLLLLPSSPTMPPTTHHHSQNSPARRNPASPHHVCAHTCCHLHPPQHTLDGMGQAIMHACVYAREHTYTHHTHTGGNGSVSERKRNPRMEV